MPKESSKSKPRFNPKILVMFLMLGVTPLIVGHLVLTSGSRDTYEELISTYLSHLAEYAQKNVLGYLERVSAQTANLATTPAIQTVVRQSNLRAPAPGDLMIACSRSNKNSLAWKRRVPPFFKRFWGILPPFSCASTTTW